MEIQDIKVGDRVIAHVGPDMDWYGTVKEIIPDTEGLYGENRLLIRVDEGCLLEHRVSRCTKIDKDNNPNVGAITIPVKADFGENVGFALLDRALELQKKYTELEGEIKRLYDFMNVARNGQLPIALKFDNDLLNIIANAICVDFRPLTEEEKKQMFASVEALNEALKTRE